MQVNAVPLPPFLPFNSLLASLKIVALVSAPRDPAAPFSGLDFTASQAQILGLGENSIALVLPKQCWRGSSRTVSCCLRWSGWPVPTLCRILVSQERCWERDWRCPQVLHSITQQGHRAWIVLEDFPDSKLLCFSVLLPGIQFPLLNTPKNGPK